MKMFPFFEDFDGYKVYGYGIFIFPTLLMIVLFNWINYQLFQFIISREKGEYNIRYYYNSLS